MVTALGVVVVRNDDSINTDSAKDVEAIKPVGIVATLINFVHRNCAGADCQRCGRSEDDDASLIKLLEMMLGTSVLPIREVHRWVSPDQRRDSHWFGATRDRVLGRSEFAVLSDVNPPMRRSTSTDSEK